MMYVRFISRWQTSVSLALDVNMAITNHSPNSVLYQGPRSYFESGGAD